MLADEYLNVTTGTETGEHTRRITLRDSVHEERHVALAANMFWEMTVARVEIHYTDGSFETVERTV